MLSLINQMKHEYDVVVVGAGPAGSSLASKVAQAGLSVLVVDKREKPGWPVQCAEFIQKVAFKEPKEAICQPISNMITHLPDGTTNSSSSPGYTIHREILDGYLATKAESDGAEYMMEATGRISDGVITVENGVSNQIKAVVVVDASGPTKDESCAHSLQYTLALGKQGRDIHVWFKDYVPGGYAWLFPKGDIANVGLAAIEPIDLKAALNRFVESIKGEFGLGDTTFRMTGGRIPTGGPKGLVEGRLMRVGDAAGATHPVSGEGIYRAIVTGRMAGEAIVEMFRSDDDRALKSYETKFENLFGRAMKRDVEKRAFWRDIMRKRELKPEDYRSLWIGFPEYYKSGNGA